VVLVGVLLLRPLQKIPSDDDDTQTHLHKKKEVNLQIVEKETNDTVVHHVTV